ncbi:maoC-like dehydratase, putative [Trypanosoma equiperdum]|uniref:MaoC-like dehydratase, putative n=4 Tax=Trypanozoon TaxID=39700 RepID=Q580H9_TRYB2|nr:maoC-like dehydratase, putative [Trypanosoma brucei gambiense DAL972]XP_846978.1 maoC-like dehydratase, putative [Trypanosoma brucei brucei TREU927]AAX79781.1 maoC-like dehydratase, putative [Trypanosoma brucei]RHW70924.1 maoC-like dehydratase [Trypanosoma brucei equiperdum]SCU65207.1 maoC-like dehydratase, putative [Trypanosoma equiperdum]AAZ12912.1 maoC-like dehydratase, putative [Trypanosoma brucei brucei TREU927]CBH13150.1 maoC-like dehydratase, putative [Trypanosoma brucei gambiense D|eukprot:XP_011775427.1 maoC-like dehydratase, putative [Trypanosoma brucei gambiense DAL972]
MLKVGQRHMGRVIRIGDFASTRRVITLDDVKAFGPLVGDSNPIHVDEAAAKAAGFQSPVVHGMLAGSLFSGLLGSELPGPQSIYMSQTLRFVVPLFVGDEVEARIEVTQFRRTKFMIAFRTTVFRIDKQTGEKTLCIEGTAVGMNKTVTFEGESEWNVPRVE